MSRKRLIDSSEFLDDATLMEDFFMSVFFRENPECIEQVLNAVLSVDLSVQTVNTQYKVLNMYGRDVIFDIYALDLKKRKYNVEMQRRSDGAKPQRARFHSSFLDVRLLEGQEDFENMTDSYVIFITEHDVLKGNKPIYRIERTIMDMDRQFNDGSHIIYVNLAYKGKCDSKLEEIIHDFKCKNADDIRNSVLRARFEELKKHPTEKELDDMSELLELRFKALGDKRFEEGRAEGREEGRAEGREEGQAEKSRAIARTMLLSGEFSEEKIAEFCQLTIEEVNELKKSA